ncbi:MAG: hypothetical protein HC793_00595, partial [Aquincola sp.]|nr:hypothetical protein [Aquincola sp.]
RGLVRPADALLPGGLPIAVVCKQVEQATTDANGAQGFSATLGNGVVGNTTPVTRVWTHTYNRHGQVLTTDGARTDVSDITTYTYYTTTSANARMGDLQQVTNALGHTTQFTQYNAHGQVLSMTDANGIVSTMTYDERQRLRTQSVLGRTTTYNHDARGLLVQVDFPSGTTTNAAGVGGASVGRSYTYTYDAAQRLTAITSASGEQVRYTRDGMGNVTREEVLNSTALGGSASLLRREFDALGRLFREIRLISGTEQTTQMGYDGQGNLRTL